MLLQPPTTMAMTTIGTLARLLSRVLTVAAPLSPRISNTTAVMAAQPAPTTKAFNRTMATNTAGVRGAQAITISSTRAQATATPT